MNNFLFDGFKPVSAAAWKQKIQVDLKGDDYNDTLLWKTEEGIVVKPFYTKEDSTNTKINLPEKGFNICQSIFIDDEKIANYLALDALRRGANAIQFKASKKFKYRKVLEKINISAIVIYFQFSFLDDDFQIELSNFYSSENVYFQTDILGNLAENGKWFINLKEDYKNHFRLD